MIAEKKASDQSDVLIQSSRTDIDKSTSTFQKSNNASDAPKQLSIKRDTSIEQKERPTTAMRADLTKYTPPRVEKTTQVRSTEKRPEPLKIKTEAQRRQEERLQQEKDALKEATKAQLRRIHEPRVEKTPPKLPQQLFEDSIGPDNFVAH